MAEVVKGIIDVEINTGNAASQLKILQQQINSVFLSLNKNNTTSAAASKAFSSDLIQAINSSKVFTAEQVKMRTAASALDDTLRKGQSTLRQYFSAKYVKSGALFAETLDLSRKRASLLQTQFIATGAASRGMQDALAIKPLQAFVSQASIAAQRTEILSSMFRQGTTQLINFGKNVQWAGRQLMVGFTVPLTIFGTTAGRVFRDLEMQVVAFKKVYGDLFTTPQELNQNLEAVKNLAKEYTKYGIAVKDTLGLAAQAAAAGRRNTELTDAVSQATRLATLGQMDQNQALETTIALQSAFKLSGEDLANSINFLNMVENQTVVSLQDLAAAIPRVAPVIQGLGGDVKDLSVFLAAMQEGGVSAEQGANALKSGLASLINPTKSATETLGGFGINLQAIIDANRGDLMKTVMGFAQALSALDDFSKQQALEEVFGKFQYARLGALFENIVRDGSQASQVMATMGYSVEELRMTADRELKTVEEAFSVQLQGAIERFKLAIAPIGEIFVKLAIPLVNFATKIAEAFNNLPDFQKKFIAFATIITGLVIPAGTMFFGLLMNLTGTLARIIQFMGAFGKGFVQGGIVGAFKNASQSAKYFSNSEIEAALAAQQLGGATEFTNSALRKQITDAMGAAGAINYLSESYNILLGKMMAAAEVAPFTMGTGATAAGLAKTGRSVGGRLIRPTQMRNAGGPIFMENGKMVPGSGNKDTVPAMLTPGEFVVNKKATRGNLGLLNAINNSVQNFNNGGVSQVAKFVSKSQSESGTNWLNAIGMAIASQGTGGSYSKHLIPQSQKLLSNAVYALQPKYNQALNARFPFAGGYGVPLGSFTNVISGKSRIDNPFIYLDEYARRSGISYDKSKHSSALRDEIRARAAGARSGQQVRIIDGPEALQRAMASNPNAYYIRLDEVFKSNRVQSSLPSGLLNILSSTSSARGNEFIKKLGAIKSGNTKTLSKQEQAAFGQSFVPSFMSLRKGGKGNLVAQYINSLSARGLKFQASHFMANGGRVPAMLTPGEYVVNKNATKNNLSLLHAINNGTMTGYNKGGKIPGMQYFATDQENRIVEELNKLNMGKVGPTSKVPRTSKFAGMGGRLQGAAMAGSFLLPMIGMQMAQSSNKFAQGIGKFLNVLTPAALALSIFPQLVPKLMTGTGALIAGVALLGFTLYKVVEQMKKVRESGSVLARAMYGSTAGVNNMAEAFGRQTATQQLTSLRAQRAGGGVSAEAQQVSSQYMQTDSAKQLIKDIATVKAAGGDAIIALRNQLARSVMAGVITTEEARGIAVEIGNELNDQNLAVNVSGQLKQLLGQNGELIKNNTINIYANIMPKINQEEVRQSAEKLYEQNTKGFLGAIGRIFDNRVIEVQKIAINGLGTQAAEAAKIQREGVDAVTLAYENGQISTEEYKNKLKQLSDVAKEVSQTSLKAVAEQLGVTVDKLEEIENKQIVIATKFGTRTTPTQQGAMLSAFKKEQQDAARIALSGLGLNETITSEIIKGLSNATVAKELEVLFETASGIMTRDLAIKIAMITKNFSLVDKLLAPGIAAGILNKDGTLKTDLTPTPTKEPGVPGPKSEIQLMRESAKQTREYAAALKVVRKEKVLNEQQIASMSAELTIEIAKSGKRNALLKEYKELITNQNKIQQELLTNAEKELQVVDLQDKIYSRQLTMIDRRINAKQKESQVEQDLNDVRQKGLDNIAKEEQKINDAYSARLDALDKVDRANERNSSRQRTRIDLATALAGGDVAGAARTASEITSQEAKYKLEDARASLEQQRQKSLDSITTMINGKLMTRKQIEDAIAVSNETIYNISQQINSIEKEKLSIYALQEQSADRRFKLELEALGATTQNIDVWKELNRLAGEYNLKLGDRPASDFTTITGGTNAPSQLTSKSTPTTVIKKPTATTQPTKTSLTKAAQAQVKSGNLSSARYTALASMYAKRYYGGVMTKGSNEPPPALKMAYGSLVPGLGNSDRVPALLTPGEFVIRKSVASAYMPLLETLNSQTYPGAMPKTSANNSANMYNTYSVNVNVAGTNASPDEIANAVMSKIKSIESRSLRGVKVVK